MRPANTALAAGCCLKAASRRQPHDYVRPCVWYRGQSSRHLASAHQQPAASTAQMPARLWMRLAALYSVVSAICCSQPAAGIQHHSNLATANHCAERSSRVGLNHSALPELSSLGCSQEPGRFPSTSQHSWVHAATLSLAGCKTACQDSGRLEHAVLGEQDKTKQLPGTCWAYEEATIQLRPNI